MAPTPHIDGCGCFFLDDSWWLVVVDWYIVKLGVFVCFTYVVVGQEQLSQPLLLRVPGGIHVDLAPGFFNNAEDSSFGCDVLRLFIGAVYFYVYWAKSTQIGFCMPNLWRCGCLSTVFRCWDPCLRLGGCLCFQLAGAGFDLFAPFAPSVIAFVLSILFW